MLSVIIPAADEERWIGGCLASLFASAPVPGGAEAIVVANGCRDGTAAAARTASPPAGWRLEVIELAEGSKPGALNAGDARARGDIRVYLDADCILAPEVLGQLAGALATGLPRYAGATPVIAPARSRLTRAYARFWRRLPFNRSVAPGYGLYAVNAAGRARWGAFPGLISDDSFVRLHFGAHERAQVAGTCLWPMAEGWAALVRTRRRQDAGLRELAREHPDLVAGAGETRPGAGEVLRLALRDPAGFAAYASVSLAVRLRRGGAEFTRGR